MFKFLKIMLYLGGFCFGLLIPAAVILLLLLHSATFKQHLEARFSETFSREIRIHGPLQLTYLHGLQFTMHDLHMRIQDTDIAAAGMISVGIDLWPLLQGEIRLNKLEVQDPLVNVVHYADGSFNFVRPYPHVTLKLARITITNANIHFADTLAAGEYSATACNFELLAPTPVDRAALNNFAMLDIAANLDCKELHKNDFTLANVKLALTGNNGKFRFAPVTMQLFGANATATVLADLGGTAPHYELEYALPQFPVGDFIARLAPQHSATGTMDFSAHLFAQGESLPQLKQTLAGQLSLQGKDLTINGSNLDEQFARYETSQHFNLVDAGAFLLAGPLGLVATKGFDFANIFLASGASSAIPAVISQWTIKDGIAQADDVAMTTRENLLALKGELDFPNGQFKDMTIALLDKQGCVRVAQAVGGSFQHPDMPKPAFLKSLAGPMLALLHKLAADEDCKVFYSGSLAVPQ